MSLPGLLRHMRISEPEHAPLIIDHIISPIERHAPQRLIRRDSRL